MMVNSTEYSGIRLSSLVGQYSIQVSSPKMYLRLKTTENTCITWYNQPLMEIKYTGEIL